MILRHGKEWSEEYDLYVQRQQKQGGRVLIDAEESWIQDSIDELAEDMMSDFNRERAVVYTTAQLYRHDRLAYIKELTSKAKEAGFIAGVKLVRGAYMEKESGKS